MSDNINNALTYIWREYHNCTDPRMDGYTTWASKQRLYEIKFAVDEALEKCPTYVGEEEYLEDIKLKKAIRILSGKG